MGIRRVRVDLGTWGRCCGRSLDLRPVTLYQFIRLSLGDRMRYVNDHGELIANDPGIPSNFYALGDFYAEVELDPAATRIVDVAPFASGDRWARMVERMDVPGL